uniref:SRR1-like domain-containing protein n=1 Tax=Suricata suricatta TaxID=37032 RepID=A0A673TI88_SURSU
MTSGGARRDVRGAMAAAAAAAEPWQAAGPRRKRRPAARCRRAREPAAGSLEAEPETDSRVVLRRIREAEEDLLLSDFWSLALEHLEQLKTPRGTLSKALGNLHLDPSPEASDAAPGSLPGEPLVPGTCHLKCVCYGLGNFATCVIARNQLAFLLLFLEKCQIPRRHCCVYDPLFSQLEIAVLDGLGVTVLRENEEGRRSVGGEPTVFYMPHCGAALYNNLLWGNWSADALSKLLVVGNSFRGLEERFCKAWRSVGCPRPRGTQTYSTTPLSTGSRHGSSNSSPRTRGRSGKNRTIGTVRTWKSSGAGLEVPPLPACPRRDTLCAGRGCRPGGGAEPLLCSGQAAGHGESSSRSSPRRGRAVEGSVTDAPPERGLHVLPGNLTPGTPPEAVTPLSGQLSNTCLLTAMSVWVSSPRPLLGHVDQALQGGGHPGLLALDEHHPPVDVDDDAAKGVELLPFVPLPDDRHEHDVVLLCLGLNEVLKVHGHRAGGHADAPLGHVLCLPPLLHGLVLEVLPPLRVGEVGDVLPRPRLHVGTWGTQRGGE